MPPLLQTVFPTVEEDFRATRSRRHREDTSKVLQAHPLLLFPERVLTRSADVSMSTIEEAKQTRRSKSFQKLAAGIRRIVRSPREERPNESIEWDTGASSLQIIVSIAIEKYWWREAQSGRNQRFRQRDYGQLAMSCL